MATSQLLLLALLWGESALAGRPLTQPGCAEGPSFWCRSGAQAGWNHIAKEDMCADCQQIVSILTRMAKESTFKDTIQKFLTHECSTLPFSSLVPHCQKLVDTYFSLFITCLEGHIKTTTICATLGLCPTDLKQEQEQSQQPLNSQSPEKWILQHLHSLHRDLPDSQTQGGPGDDLPFPFPMCWMCRSFVGRIEATIPKEAIAKAMSQLCRFMPGTVGSMCQCLMEKYTVTVLDLILGKVGPRLICGMLFLCTTGENCSPDRPLVPLLDQSARCQACLTVTSLAKSTLQANSTAAEVEAALLRACSSSASLDWQECQSFIEQHQPQLVTWLPKPWASQRLCQELGTCEAQMDPTLGAKGCAQGPAYWCSSPEAAKQCQAMEHCQAHGWA